VRITALVLIFSAFCPAEDIVEDVVRLRSGGELTGRVIARYFDNTIVLEMASGVIHIADSRIESIESGRRTRKATPRKICRDEWFFLLKEERVVGWHRLLHWEHGDRVQVEERRVMFADRSERRRVEIGRKDGTPLEYLWISSTPGRMQVWSGQIKDGCHVRQTRNNGVIVTVTAPWKKGVQLPLIAKTGAPLFDPRTNRLQVVEVGENWPGRILPTSEARVKHATSALARTDIRKLAQDAALHPLTPRPEDRAVHHLAGGVSLRVPHVRWVDTRSMRSEGAIFTVENRITFARLEVTTERVRAGTITAAARRARTRVALQYDHVGALGEPKVKGKISLQRIELRRGRERWQGILRVEVRAHRTITALALAPLRTWSAEKPNLERILNSLVASD